MLKLCFGQLELAERLNSQLKYLCYLPQSESFAFENKQFLNYSAPGSNSGWNIYSVEGEFKRMKLNPKDWRISTVNRNYGVCESYPKNIIVPKVINDNGMNIFFITSNHYR